MEKLNNNIAHLAVSFSLSTTIGFVVHCYFRGFVHDDISRSTKETLLHNKQRQRVQKLVFCSYKDSSDPIEFVGEIEG